MTNKFTERFNEILNETNISQTELAKAVGISKQSITDFKSGKSFPSIHTLRLLCKTLKVSADYLLGVDEK